MNRRELLIGAGATLAACAIPTPRSSRIVVIGAGLSGLLIAHELVKRGRDVLVLEAQPRVGGRIRTVRGFRDDLYVDAGAIHVAHPDTAALLAELGVATVDGGKRAKLAHVAFARGERRVYAPGEAAPEDHPLSPEEAALDRASLMKRYFALATTLDPRATSWTAELAKLDRVTAADWLRDQGASPGFAAGVAQPFMPAPLEQLSALAMIRDWAAILDETAASERNPGHGGRIAGGSDHLPLALAHLLGDRVVTGTELVHLERRADGATLTVRDRSGTHRIAAARVVLTMPFTVLRTIAVAPAWTPLKARAIAELEMTTVTRVWLEADRRFWLERGQAGRAEADLPSGTIRDETEALSATGGVLGIYATGDAGRRFAALTADARITAMLDDVDRVHPDMRAHFVHGDSHAWTRDPFARGAYGYFTLGQLTELAPAAAAHEGVVHFAGDGTSYRPGFMHGAIESARRVVRELE